MKAAYIMETGGPELIRFGELRDPKPGPHEALVRIKASAINPVDTYIRAGSFATELSTPFIPGSDFAGVVEAVGERVRAVKPGDRVWGSNQGVFGRQGTLAELVAVHEQWLYPIPAAQLDDEAAAGALTGITAHLGLFSVAKLRAGEIVFVNGGTGGVGSAVVQLAKWKGARVITTAGTSEKRRLCESLGADLALDYKDPELARKLGQFCEQSGGVNVWFETLRAPDLDLAVSAMAQGGRIVLMAGSTARPELPLGPFYFKDLRLLGFLMITASPERQREAALDINRCFEAGKWRPLVGQTFPLDSAAAAHRLQEESTLGGGGSLTGKIVVRV